MLKGINSHFSSKQKLHFSTRTHWERFQPAHAVTRIHCPDGRFKPKGMGLENARSSPHSSHLHGLWMKCSGSGIPGERGPRASHTPCNVLHFQVSPFSMSRSILMPMFPTSSPPPLLYHLSSPGVFPTTAIPSQGGNSNPRDFPQFRNLGAEVCTSEHPIQQINLVPGKERPARHPQTSLESPLEPTSQGRMENSVRWGCVQGQLGERCLLIPDITWLTHDYLLVLHKRNPACSHLSRGKAVGFALETQNKACRDGAVPGLPAALTAKRCCFPSAWIPAIKSIPVLSPKANLLTFPLNRLWVERGKIHSCFSRGKPDTMGVWLLGISHQNSPAPPSLESLNLHFCPTNPGRNSQTSFLHAQKSPSSPRNQPAHPIPLQHKEVQAVFLMAEHYPLSPPHPPCAPSTFSWPPATV